jgi:uncharacterized protein (DUF305 family)
MNALARILATATMLAATPAIAQEAHSGHGDAGAFPEVCKAPSAAQPMMHGGMDGMNEYQRESMDGMMKMDRDMMQGMMKQDADVAFICGMIAHHQGAIDMAKVELKYGDNAWAKEMAQKVIDAQTKEIADMTAWLAENAK